MNLPKQCPACGNEGWTSKGGKGKLHLPWFKPVPGPLTCKACGYVHRELKEKKVEARPSRC